MEIRKEDISAAVRGYLDAPTQSAQPDPAVGAQISVTVAADRNPDYEADLRAVARRTGIPLDSVRAFPDEVKRNERIGATDFEQLARDFPSTAKYLTLQDNADIAHDDIANMSMVEQAGRFLSKSGSALASSVPQVNAGLWGLGQAAAEFAAPLAEPLAGTILPENPLTRVAQGFAEMRTQQEGIAKGMMPQTYGGNIEAGWYSGLQSMGAMGLMIAPAIAAGSPQLALGGMSGMAGGSAYGQARDAGKDPLNSLAFGASQAAIEYATEKLPVGRLLGDLKQGTPFVTMLMRQLAVEIPGEQVATILQDLNEWAVLKPNATFKDYLAERPDAAAQTLVATIVASGGVVSASKAVDVAANRIANRDKQAQTAIEGGDALTQLDASAAQSKLRVRSPEDFQAIVREAAADGPVQDVFINAESLAQSGVDLTALARVSPAVAAQFADAQATGGDVRIPVDEFATYIAGTDLSPALLPLLKTAPAGMTQAEAVEFMNTRGEALQAEVEAVLAEQQGDVTFKESLGAVETSILEQLNTAARFTPDVNQAYAAMTANFYAAQAARLGVTPGELQSQYPVRIQAEGFGQLNQGPADTIANVQTAWADAGIDGSVSEKDDIVTLSRIIVPETAREQGAGTAAMQRLIDYADATGKHVVLSPSADFGGNVARLKAFYKRFGFVENKGRNRAFSTSESMYRQASDKLLHQDTPDAQRGAYNIDTRTITLLKGADLSTFLHESGHFYLEVMADLAGRMDSPPAILDDFQKTLDWFGVTDPITWAEMTLEQKRPYHEQWARGFEAYLFEGKSPSTELQSIFDRFRSWLMATYRSLTALNVELTDEVRTVFGRMLATTDQIVETESQQAYTPLFTDAEQAAMSPEEWAQYQSLGVEATQDAIQQMETRSLRDMKWLSGARGRALAALQREAADRRKAVRREVEAEVMAEPLNQARTFLKRGIDPEGQPVSGPHKFQIEAMVDLYGGEGDKFAMLNWEPLGYGQYGMLAADGLNPDIVADRFGYSSGDDLVRALLSQENQRERITALTDQRMLERYGDLSDPAAISRAADEAVHNDARARFVATEVNALQKALGQRAILARAARQFAEATIARLRVRDVRPSQWTTAEARAARAAQAALGRNDIQAAAVEKKRQLLNNYAARAAQNALKEVEKGVDYMKRLSSANSQNGMRGEALVQMNALLARFDLRTSLSLRQIDEGKTQSLQSFITAESERLSAVMPDLPGFVLDENYRKHYRDMTVEEFRGLVESARQLATLARREQRMYSELRAMSFEQEADAILAAMRRARPEVFDDNGDPIAVEPSFVPSLAKSTAQLGDKFSGEFLNAETILSILEGGEFGQVHESLFGRMSGRTNWKATRMERVYADLAPVFKQWNFKEKRDYSRKAINVPSIGTAITRENALVAALLYGSADGRARLQNYGWGPYQMQGIIDVLDARDWKLADAIWRQFDEKLWPELKALNDRTRGKSPPKVEPAPFPTKFGEQRGGYFRLKYDTDLDERAFRMDEGAAVKELLGGGMGMSAKTNQGTSTQRLDNVTMRPRLDLGVFAEAVNETVHDIGMREAVADTMRLLNDKRLQTAIKSAVGVPAYRALVTRVREIAAPPRNPSGVVAPILAAARRNTIVALMSGVFTALQNIVGFVPALARVNAGSLGSEIAKFYSPAMGERYRFAVEQSTYMRNRYKSFDRDLKAMANKLSINGQLLPDTATMLAIMGVVDRGVSVPVWNAAFKDGMGKLQNDVSRAVDYADHIVRQTQGSGRDVDLPAIMAGRNEWLKVATMFYSYFSGQLNMLVRSGAIAKQEAKTNPRAAVAKFAVHLMLIVVLPAVLTELLTGLKGGDDDEDEEQIAKRYAKALTMYGAGMLPLVRDVAPFLWSSFDSDSHNFGYKFSPVQSAVEGVVKGMMSVEDLFADDPDIVDARNIIMGTSFAFGLPGKLISDVVTGFHAWASGDAGPQAMVLGPPRR